MPTVHGHPLSPFVRKVRVALIEKGISYDLNPILPMPPHNQTPEFRAISPIGKVPAYEDGDFAISDSSAILAYLERSHAEPPLYPAQPRPYARALWFEELADTKLAEAVGAVFFQRIVRPAMMKESTDETIVQGALRESLPPLFDYLEGQLGAQGYLVGDQLSVADLGVGTMLRQLQMAGETIDAARWPQLAGYGNRILTRPSFASCAADEEKLMASM